MAEFTSRGEAELDLSQYWCCNTPYLFDNPSQPMADGLFTSPSKPMAEFTSPSKPMAEFTSPFKPRKSYPVLYPYKGQDKDSEATYRYDRLEEYSKRLRLMMSERLRLMMSGPSAAPNKKTTGNGEASYDQSSNQATHGDQSSNQATHGDSDPYNPCISVDNLATNDVTDEHLRQIFTPYGELACVGIIAGTQCGFVQFFSRSSAEEAIRKLNGTELAGKNLRLSFANKQVRYKAIETIATLPPGWARALPPVSDRDPSPVWFSEYKTVETGDTRIQTRVKDLESDKSEIVDSYPKRPMRVDPCAAPNNKTGNGEGSYQATHSGDMDPKIPNNTSILVDSSVPNVVTEEQLRKLFTQHGEVGYVKIMAGTQFGFVQFVSRSCAEEAIRNLNGRELAGQNLKLSFSNKKERMAEYLNNGLPYGWSGSGIFRGLPPLCSDSGIPIEAGGWFSAPSPFKCGKGGVDPADPRLEPTHEDVKSDEAIWALYKRWCDANNVHRTPEEMQMRFGFFKKDAIKTYEMNRDSPLCSYGMYIWADDPNKEPRRGLAG